MSAILAYVKGAVEELHQVRWPTRQQAVRLSVIVLCFTLASALTFGIIDFGFSALVQYLLSLAQ